MDQDCLSLLHLFAISTLFVISTGLGQLFTSIAGSAWLCCEVMFKPEGIVRYRRWIKWANTRSFEFRYCVFAMLLHKTKLYKPWFTDLRLYLVGILQYIGIHTIAAA